MENREIARILWETADLMEIAGEDSFRIRSYRNGATAIESHPERIEDISETRRAKSPTSPASGRASRRASRRSSSAAPASAATSCCKNSRRRARSAEDPGLGPKGIALLFEHYRIGTIDELERICQEQKLRVLPRMGAKLEEKVLGRSHSTGNAPGDFS